MQTSRRVSVGFFHLLSQRTTLAKRLGLGLILLVPGMSFADSSNTAPVYDTGVGNAGIACAATKAGSDLGCTANDTSIALVNTAGGQPTCIAAQTTTVDLQLSAQLQTTATVRHSLGIFIALDGKDPAVTVASGGSAACDVFGVPTTPTPWGFDNSNTCGNLSSAATATTFALPHTVTVPCIANGTGPNSGMVVLSAVATWDNNADTCLAAADLQVGTTSKCKAGSFLIPVIGSLIIKKVAVSGGDVPFPFTTTVTTPANFTLIDGAQQLIQTNAALSATSQTVSATEGATAGWSLASISCVDINGADASSFVTTNLATGTVTASLDGTNTSATCTYTNTNTVAITLNKTVTGGPASGAPGAYSFSADCGASGTFAGSIILPGGTSGSGSITGIPAGAVCSVSETSVPTAPTNYTWGTTPAPVILTTTAAGPNSAAFTNTLTRQTSSIALNKTVTGGPASGVSGTFNFSADCSASSDGTFTGAITLTAATSGSSTIAAVPAGAICSVSETSVPAAPAFYSWGATPPAVSVTTTTAGPNTASFTNTLSQLDPPFTLTKTVTGGPAGGVSGTFTFSINCGSAGVFTQAITLSSATSGSVGISNIPGGSTCVFSETLPLPAAPSGFTWGSTPAAQTVVINGANVAFVNTLNAVAPPPVVVPAPALRTLALTMLVLMLAAIGALSSRRLRRGKTRGIGK
jgi:hypothetical protein